MIYFIFFSNIVTSAVFSQLVNDNGYNIREKKSTFYHSDFPSTDGDFNVGRL